MTDFLPESTNLPAESRVCLPPDSYDTRLLMKGGMPGCPCCSRTAVTFSRFFAASGIYQAYVHCAHCDVQVFKNAHDLNEARNLAAAAWSERPSPAAGAEVERARQELSALASLILRPPLDDVLIEQDVALRSAAAIRTVCGALVEPLSIDHAVETSRLVRAAIRGLLHPPANSRSRRRPLWSAVMALFALGSTTAQELCRKHGFDPDREVRA